MRELAFFTKAGNMYPKYNSSPLVYMIGVEADSRIWRKVYELNCLPISSNIGLTIPSDQRHMFIRNCSVCMVGPEAKNYIYTKDDIAYAHKINKLVLMNDIEGLETWLESR